MLTTYLLLQDILGIDGQVFQLGPHTAGNSHQSSSHTLRTENSPDASPPHAKKSSCGHLATGYREFGQHLLPQRYSSSVL
ncbi:hypothetical protein EPI10_015505 [Gossypium australe]|uniref:Uncharacterized protein n=1 Tax=Gossypium australe TaxID=47621 RepID=A0A5B6VL30_9ROSI|nr:hypothetical protein EPI10_015505 [Gossypium australe]